MFIALIQRIGLLQINRMLVFTGDQGRKVIATVYPPFNSVVAVAGLEESMRCPALRRWSMTGRPARFRRLTRRFGESRQNVRRSHPGLPAVGDTVLKPMPLLHVLGARKPIDERKLRNAIELGNGRTFEQDPKYAIRLLVDIAIKALSPAINDPTTAVQALDQIEDLLLRLGQRHLEIGAYRDSGGELRLVIPCPTWDDLLRLAFSEILFFGATSVQVMRRMNALVADLVGATEGTPRGD